MLNSLIRTSLRFRLLTIALALVASVYGGYTLVHLPIDVFPDLDRPRVTVITEAPGLAPEEIEAMITAPLEFTFNGATGVQAVRSSSTPGLSIIYVEFDWDTDIYIARQVVNEKLSLVAETLPPGIRPQLAPISSIMGQIMFIGMWSEGDATDPMQLRTLADWVVRPRVLAVPGVAQVFNMGGERKQYQVLVNPDALVAYGVTLRDVEQALEDSNANAAGGYIVAGPDEYLVRSLGRIQSLDELAQVVVKNGPRPVQVRQVARVLEGPQLKRGDAAVNGRPAALMVVAKQPGADTRKLTAAIERMLAELSVSLPADVRIEPNVFQQRTFIDRAIRNVVHALRDGALLVVIVLFLFLMNVRTTLITLVAIPLSLVVTAIVFYWLGLGINTMTLGGLAVAIGELVDDSIVDVENIFRRLRENAHRSQPLPTLRVVYEASREIRGSIVFSTILVVLVFVPLFALGGMEGRLFVPLAAAYIVSILVSLLVSLTVTPVLSYWLLPGARVMRHERDSLPLRVLKPLAAGAIRLSILRPWPILGGVTLAVAVSAVVVMGLGRDFLPQFNEGAVQVNVVLPPGTSLTASNRIGAIVDRRMMDVEGVVAVGRRTGRAEQDEHDLGVNISELLISLDPENPRPREDVLADIRAQLAQVPGARTSAEQPLAHLISHMLSGVQAQIGIKVRGENLERLREIAARVQESIKDVAGITDLYVEPQVEVNQIQVRLDQERLAYYGLHAADMNRLIETAMRGRVVSQIILGQRRFDMLVRLDEPYRNDPQQLRRLSIELHDGSRLPLEAVTRVVHASGPNMINREAAQRRIIVQCNTVGRDLSGIVDEIQQRLAPIRAALPSGYSIDLAGQFESQQSATRTIGLLSIVAIVCMFLALYTLFRSVNLSLQVLAALPMAAIGAVAALVVTGQSLTVASLVGFVSLAGIASRNGILLITHYLHLVRYEGETFSPRMIERAGQERLAPMLMTALTAGIALLPLVLAAGEPGKEILYPVATVILGGLFSSTLLDFFVHPALFWRFGRFQAERQLSMQAETGGALDDVD